MSDGKQHRCTIYGYLYGAICDELSVWDQIGGAQIIALPSDNDSPNVGAFAQPHLGIAKPVVNDIDEAQFQKQASAAVMIAKTDEHGAFCLDDPNYDGGNIDLYVCIDRIPAPTLKQGYVELETPFCLYLGTYRPLHFGDVWYLITVIPASIWCRIRRLADLWVVVGRVTPCEDTTVGLGGLTVKARDADIIQHDLLGTAVTNPSGVFRIDYPGASFRAGTWLNIELFGGPDIYFEITDADANVLLDESHWRGRQTDRRDRSNCFCVALCVDVPPPPTGDVPTAWTNVGDHFTIPAGSDMNDFDASGYGGAAKYAFHGTMRMLGSIPRYTAANHPVEYRFLISDTTTANGTPPPADASFTRIVGAGPDVGLFAKTRVGQMIRYTPYKVVQIDAIQTDLDADGWLDVNTSIARIFAAHPTLTPADIPDFAWLDLDPLMAINTIPLTSEPNVPTGATNPGDAVPAGDRIAIEDIAIRFQAREVVNKAANLFNLMPGNGTTLNAIVINNNAVHAKIAMTEHLSSTACTPLSGSPHVAFTAYHPHIADVRIRVRSNDGVYDHSLDDTATKPASSDATIPLAGNTNSPGVSHLHNPAVDLPAGLHKCTYIVTLTVLRRLHNGDDAVIANTPQTSFYYEP